MSGVYRSRLKVRLDETTEKFISSLRTGRQLLPYEIDSSIAHALMLREQNILTREQVRRLVGALDSLRTQKLPAKGFEDIHEYVESAVTRIVGEKIGGRLHTARSRNDQVATVTRMLCREKLLQLGESTLSLTSTLSRLAEKHSQDPALSYTHLQQAQIQTLGHQMQSYLSSIIRGLERLSECYARTNVSPLGSSAGAGSTIKVDRKMTAELLGFDGVLENCQDAVQSRDYAVEAVFIQSLIMLDLCRVAEDLILWSTSEFRYYELPDSLSSPSSVMPHKKNADVLEMVRANAAVQLGILLQMLTLLKGLPSGYNRDLQSEKEILFHSFPLTMDALKTTEACLRLGTFKTETMEKRAEESDIFALPFAEWLVRKKRIPFRQAHRIAGRITAKYRAKTSLGKNTRFLLQMLREDGGPKLNVKELNELKLSLSPRAVLEATHTEGGPSEAQVMRARSTMNKELDHISNFLSNARKELQTAQENLHNAMRLTMHG